MGTGAGLRVRAVPLGADHVDLDLPAGTMLAVVGPTGSGRSTFLRRVAGLDRTAGSVELGGVPVTAVHCGYAAPQHELLAALTPVENLAVRLLAIRRSPSAARREVEQLLDELGLPESSRYNLVEQLSGGQQQRVAVARALVGDPGLVVLDEPTSELDPASAARVWARVRVAAERGAVVVAALGAANPQDVADRVLRVRRRDPGPSPS